MNANIFVAGDLMLDKFEYGKVSRISPEAPVPVFQFEREKHMLGGVGNVAANLIALGCEVSLAGVIGDDDAGAEVDSLLRSAGINSILLRQKGFNTVVKTRLIAGNNHILRADRESSEAEVVTPAAFDQRILKAIKLADVVLISDYAKGFLTASTCQKLIAVSRSNNKAVLVDPKGVDWEKYRGATLVKPNLKEFSLVCGRTFNPKADNFVEEITASARALCKRFGLRNLLVTLSEYGMMLIPASPKVKAMHIKTKAKEVFDVSGAGDTALAAFGAAIGSGASLQSALEIANIASGIVVSKLGTATVSSEELEEAMSELKSANNIFDIYGNKIVRASQIGAIVKNLKRRGKKIGFTNGCFDCCHLGHLYSFVETKNRCDVLIVGLNSDRSVKRNKGPNRPIQDEVTRSTLIAALSMVDYVVIFDEDVPLKLVKTIRPDVIAKEGYPLAQWPEGQLVKSLGGEVVELKRLDGYSTSALIKRMHKA